MAYKDPAKRRENHAKIRRRNAVYVEDFLSKNPCVKCGEADIRCLDFDHLDQSKKSFAVGAMKTRMHHSIKRIQEEIDKCQVLCSNCHRIKSHENGDWFYRRSGEFNKTKE